MASGATVVLSFATVFTAIALLFVALAFATDHWLEYTVDREELSGLVTASSLEQPWFFSRDRGIFRTCYSGDDAYFLDDHDNVVDGTCILEDGYQLEPDDDKSNWGDDYETRIHLMRSHFGCFCFSMLLLVIGCIVGAVGCWKLSGRLIRIAGLVVFVGAFLAAGGMAFFHGYEYLERQKIDQPEPEFPAYWNERTETDLVTLQEHSSIRYGYSYFFGWIGMALGAISAILYLCAAYSLTASQNPPEPQRFYDDNNQYKSRSYLEPTYGPDPMPYGYNTNPGNMGPGFNMGQGYLPSKMNPQPYAIGNSNTMGGGPMMDYGGYGY